MAYVSNTSISSILRACKYVSKIPVFLEAQKFVASSKIQVQLSKLNFELNVCIVLNFIGDIVYFQVQVFILKTKFKTSVKIILITELKIIHLQVSTYMSLGVRRKCFFKLKLLKQVDKFVENLYDLNQKFLSWQYRAQK